MTSNALAHYCDCAANYEASGSPLSTTRKGDQAHRQGQMIETTANPQGHCIHCGYTAVVAPRSVTQDYARSTRKHAHKAGSKRAAGVLRPLQLIRYAEQIGAGDNEYEVYNTTQPSTWNLIQGEERGYKK